MLETGGRHRLKSVVDMPRNTQFGESQGTMSDFCRGKGIALTTFSGWLRRKRGGVPVLADPINELKNLTPTTG